MSKLPTHSGFHDLFLNQSLKVQKYKQRSTRHTYKTKDRVTRTPLKTGGELRCSGWDPAPLVTPVVLI
jgi:hypothetical protein